MPAGSIAGVRCYRKGDIPTHWSVMYNGIRYVAHRLVVQLHSMELSPNLVVNHINCNPFDNKISNLEVCTVKENNKRKSNSLNIRLSCNNKSGENGIIEMVNISKGYSYTYAMASVSIDRKLKSKKFSYNKYGKDQA